MSRNISGPTAITTDVPPRATPVCARVAGVADMRGPIMTRPLSARATGIAARHVLSLSPTSGPDLPPLDRLEALTRGRQPLPPFRRPETRT